MNPITTADCPCGWAEKSTLDVEAIAAAKAKLRLHAMTCTFEINGERYWATWRKTTCPVKAGQRFQHPTKGWVTVMRIGKLSDVLVIVGHELKMKPYWDVKIRRDGANRNESMNLQPFLEPEVTA